MMTAMTCYLPPPCMIREMNRDLDFVEKTYKERMEEDDSDGDVASCWNDIESESV